MKRLLQWTKKPDFYLNNCLWMMGLLNLVIILFLAVSVVLTQYRIAYTQDARSFLPELIVMPESPEIRMLATAACCLVIGAAVCAKRDPAIRNTGWFSVLSLLEILTALLLMARLDMAYNGIVLFIFADILYYVKRSWDRLAVVALAFLCYLAGNYEVATLVFPMNSFETWVSFYDYSTERLFLGMRTFCELANMMLFISYMILLLLADRKENERIVSLNEQLQRANEQLHVFAEEKEQMGETRERNRLAREIHDTLGHILTGISVGVDAASVLMDVSPEAAKQQMETIGDMARKGLNDVRRSVRKLKPDALERMSLENAIYQMAEEMSRGTNTKIYFVSYMDRLEFEPDIEETVYRIVQESTTNAIRHGKATEIWIRVSEKNGEMIWMISDNGRGCDTIREGFGLRHMRERVELAGGTLFYEGTFGFTVIARIPIRRKTGDTISGPETEDTVSGSETEGTVSGSESEDTVSGSESEDTISGSETGDTVSVSENENAEGTRSAASGMRMKDMGDGNAAERGEKDD